MEDIGGLQAFLDQLPEQERRIRHIGFTRLIQGKICDSSILKAELGLTDEELQHLIATMEKRGTLQWNHTQDRLVGTGGLSIKPTPHSVSLKDLDLHAWCAADAVGIPAALDLDATIHSSCHTCGRTIQIVLTQGSIDTADPPDSMLWVFSGDPAQSVSGHT